MEQKELYDKLAQVFLLTGEDETGLQGDTPTARDILVELIYKGEASNEVKADLQLVYQKIKEAHLLIQEELRLLKLYD
jgi:hypothetical protein